jgi:sodium-dependent dicarboxylate transporter 2/3/5
MGFGVPLAGSLLLLAYVILIVRYRVEGSFVAEQWVRPADHPGSRWVIVVGGLAVLGWLSEPLHGVSAPLIALGVAAVLFGTGVLAKDDLGRLDWSTLGLIAGGISLGRLIEQTGILDQVASQVEWTAYSSIALLGALVVVAALLSAVMSNTGTAAMLIPLAMSILPTPSTAIIIAMATSLGMPFVISTPPNAMAYSKGGITATDLLVVGLLLMSVGCIVVTLTGGAVLRVFNLP